MIQQEGLFPPVVPIEKIDDWWNKRKPTRADYLDYEPEILPNSKEKLNMVIDNERAERVLLTLLDALRSNEYPYMLDSVRLPHDPRHMPEELPYGSREHAMFMFNLCYYMRGGIKSTDAVRRLTKMYHERPDLFICDVAAETEPEEISDLLTKHGLGFQTMVSGQWVENSKRLLEKWDGDPRTIFAFEDGVTDEERFETSLDRVKNDQKGGGFKGFQEKMTSMIIYYLMDGRMIDTFEFPIPVDIHVMRVSIANELITFPDAPHGTNLYTQETLAALRKFYYEFAVKHDVSSLDLCNAVWLLSESLCGTTPGNVTNEPLGRSERDGRKTILVPLEVNPNDPNQQRAYDASCGHCPVEQYCTYSVPGKPYYIHGGVFIRGERERFPERQGALFDVNGNDLTIDSDN